MSVTSYEPPLEKPPVVDVRVREFGQSKYKVRCVAETARPLLEDVMHMCFASAGRDASNFARMMNRPLETLSDAERNIASGV